MTLTGVDLAAPRARMASADGALRQLNDVGLPRRRRRPRRPATRRRLAAETDEARAARRRGRGARGARRLDLRRPDLGCPPGPRLLVAGPVGVAGGGGGGARSSPRACLHLDGGAALPGSLLGGGAPGRRRPPLARPARGPAVGRASRSSGALAAYFPGSGSDDQRAAARIACTRWTSVVTGGPGTGKTTTIARLLGVLLTVDPITARRAGGAHGQGGRSPDAGLARGHAPRRLPRRVGAAGEADDASARRARIRALEASTVHRLLGWRSDSSTRFRARPAPTGCRTTWSWWTRPRWCR